MMKALAVVLLLELLVQGKTMVVSRTLDGSNYQRALIEALNKPGDLLRDFMRQGLD